MGRASAPSSAPATDGAAGSPANAVQRGLIRAVARLGCEVERKGSLIVRLRRQTEAGLRTGGIGLPDFLVAAFHDRSERPRDPHGARGDAHP
jgi:hypothetical protein